MKLSFLIAFLTFFSFVLSGEELVDSLNSISSHEAKVLDSNPVVLKSQYLDSIEQYRDSLQKQLRKQKVNFRYERVFYYLFIMLLGISFAYRLKKDRQENDAKKTELLLQIESLKKQQATWSVSTAPVSKTIALNKAKLERTIGNKLGESSWLILNSLLRQPAISNKAIAKEVSLSVEGVSSSLRRMYTAFEVKASHNKKIALITKAVRISIEKEVDARKNK